MKKWQEFFWDSKTDTFFYVNYQEKGCLPITKENKRLYNFFNNIFCERWEDREEVVDSFRFVDYIEDIYFDEEGNVLLK